MPKRLAYILTIVSVMAVIGVVALGLSAITRKPRALTSVPVSAPQQSTAPASSGPAPQSSDAGGVTVAVQFDPKAVTNQTLTFNVALNTHSVELSQYDLARRSKITLDPGGILSDITWKPEGTGSGHHVSGTLLVKDPTGGLAGAKSVTLEITGLADPGVRRFQWQKN